MASYYTKFCVPLVVNEDVKTWVKKVHEMIVRLSDIRAETGYGDEALEQALKAEMTKDFIDYIDLTESMGADLNVEEETGNIYLESEQGDVEFVGYFLQSMLQKIDDPKAWVDFSWSSTSSSLAPDSEGGGVMVVTRDGFVFEDTSSMLKALIEDRNNLIAEANMP